MPIYRTNSFVGSTMKKNYIIIVFFFILAAVSSYAMFCNKCGQQLPDDSIFCSKCGAKVSAIGVSVNATKDTDILKLINTNFEPVNDFEVFVFTSNYATCISKYPEFQISFNKNKPGIEILKQKANKLEKEIISYYYQKWDILKQLQEVWSKANGSNLQKQAYMIQFSGILKLINKIIAKLKNNASASEQTKMRSQLLERITIYHIKSNYLLLSNIKILKDQPVGICEIAGNKLKIMHLGDKAQGVNSIVGPIFIDNSKLTSPISDWITKDEFIKRTNYSEINN